ncbi:hypothetical protein [Mycolicibacterium cosmeticum]|uniref:hypothetical protein n=1 Tax=Mycolicibacterium cosmeticum TaxID=258533 RepID=UPI003204DB6B
MPTHDHTVPRQLVVSADSEVTPAPGVINVQGSKNCFNHLLVVGLLGDDNHHLTLDNVPRISDRHTTLRILAETGLDVDVSGDRVDIGGAARLAALRPRDVRRLRVSICYGAAVAAARGMCFIPLPGGDAFTPRPIDLHVGILAAAGADVSVCDAGVWVDFDRAPRAFDRDVSGPYGPSMGASVTALAVAAVATGTSTIRGISHEPEVDQVKQTLRLAGVTVADVDAQTCIVEGAGGPLSGELARTVPADRQEAATYICIAAARRKPLQLRGLEVDDLPQGLREAMDAVGIGLQQSPDGSVPAVRMTTDAQLHGIEVDTAPHPGYPTDAQPQLAALLAFAHGNSVVHETIYRERTSHVGELRKVNIGIEIEGPRQRVTGGQTARSGTTTVRDIRCGAAVLVAAAASNGHVVLDDPSGHLCRGYGDLTTKLNALDLRAQWAA